jgi:Ca-activated chloride channel homolog
LITLRADRSLIRSDGFSPRHLAMGIRAPEAKPQQGRLPVNLGFVIDRSGSMHGEKLARAKDAVLVGIRSLREGDRFAVVAYDEHVQVVVASTEATREAREAAVRAVEAIQTGGGTDLHGGWLVGCRQLLENRPRDAVSRCLLLTDGLANHGIADHDEIVRQAANQRDNGVSTTSFGVGADFDEVLLRRMADTGGGNFRFIEAAAQIRDFIAGEVGEALSTTVREAVIVVDAGDGAVVESLNDFPCRQESGGWKIPIGSLYSGQTLTPVLRVTFPQGPVGQFRDVRVRVDDPDNALATAHATARFTWATREESDGQPRHIEVDRLVAALDAARAERDAIEQNRAGDFGAAYRAIQACIARIRVYVGSDDEIGAILFNLEHKAARYSRRMDPMSSKAFYADASQTLTGRFRAVTEPPSSTGSQSLLVFSEWEAQAGVASVLQKVAAANATLLGGIDLRSLSEALAHTDERGCLLDLSRDPTGSVELRLQAPKLCPQCRTLVQNHGVAGDRLDKLVEALRLLGTPSSVVH